MSPLEPKSPDSKETAVLLLLAIVLFVIVLAVAVISLT